MNTGRRAASIPLHPWYFDHGFGGRAVLAAVETMILLAAETARRYPEADIRVMQDGRFAKFLELPRDSARLDVLLECLEQEETVQTVLLSQTIITTMKRLKEHGRISFPRKRRTLEKTAVLEPAPPPKPVKRLDARYIYTQLVPFGPAYRSLKETLLLTGDQAWCRLRTPATAFADDVQQLIGSPFAFDGAMHAACVLGQQFVDYAPFPVGFDRRLIVRPTQPAGDYIVWAALVSYSTEEMVFDLHIIDGDGRVFEEARGVRMRDAGRRGAAAGTACGP